MKRLNWKYLRSLLEQKGSSQAELACAIGISIEQTNRILNGAVCDPRGSTVERLAEYFGLVPADLYTDSRSQQEAMALGEQSIIYNTGRLIPVNKYANATEANPPPAPAARPPRGQGAYGAIARQTADPGSFGVLLIGDSMSPAYPGGTQVLCSPACGVRNGRVHYVRDKQGNELVRKVLINGDSYALVPLNTDHPPRTVRIDETEQIALVVAANLPR